MQSRRSLSIVVPLHNEADSLPLLVSALHDALAGWRGDWDITCVDDGSRDDTWARLVALSSTDSRINGLRFTRNFGKEAAILAGLEAARGEWVVVMDGDGQHPPALLRQMLACAEDNAIAIVAAKKRARQADTWLARVLSRGFNRIMLAATGLDLQNACDYRLLKRPVVDALLRMPERIRFFRAMTVWTGFKQSDIEFDVMPRLAGQTAWSTRGLISLAVNGITGFSAQPLTLVFRLGVFGLVLSLALTAQAIWSWETGTAISGWTSLTIVMVFFGSANLMALGVLGAYLAQLFNEIKARPPYLVGERIQNMPPAHIERAQVAI
jgi:glycosyltransferase involved in cell wall biosynthesis